MSNDEPGMLAREMARRCGASIENIRHYERLGLMPRPKRSTGNYRLYHQEHVERMLFIRRARALSFSLEEIRALLRVEGRHDEEARTVRRGIAVGRLHHVHDEIVALSQIAKTLEKAVCGCAATGEPEACPIEAAFGL